MKKIRKMRYSRKIIVTMIGTTAAVITILVGGISIYEKIWKEHASPPSVVPVVPEEKTPEDEQWPQRQSEEKREEIKPNSYSNAGVDKKPEISEKERRLDEFNSLINKTVTTYPDKQNVAMVIESSKTNNGISPENLLYNLLKTEKVNVIINFFEEKAFKSKGFFREIYDGNTELLRKADVFSQIDYVILGRIDYSFRKTGLIDKDLVSCDIDFSYKTINKNGEVVESDSISVIGPGFSEDMALERGLEMLCEKYFNRIMRSIL